jgi:copper transport protein
LAHADLLRSEPAANSLVLNAPDTLTLTFTEPVLSSDPAPVITLLDERGTSMGSSPLPVESGPDDRTLVIRLPSLDLGTYTVRWAVTSATDGHALSGTYAFRVGGGIPPGSATTADTAPAVWAVITRWLTFVGAALAVGVLTLGRFQTVAPDQRWRRWRMTLVMTGSGLGLAATLAEPVLSSLRSNAPLSIGDALLALPDAWWWRPAALGGLLVLGMGVRYARRDRFDAAYAFAGVALGLASLLGLALTSHAAGRNDQRWIAIAVDLVHQWSVAVWFGLLLALGAWKFIQRGTPAAVDMPAFSRTSLVLVVVGLVSGLLNTGYVYPIVDRVRDQGLSTAVIAPLWDALYGKFLAAKLAVLVVALILAVRHRRAVHNGPEAGMLERLRSTLRWETAAVAIVVIGGSALALSVPPSTIEATGLDAITLVSPTSLDVEPTTTLVHLTIAPASVGENELQLRLTDATGAVPALPAPRVSLDFTSLDHATERRNVGVEVVDEPGLRYRASGLDLSLEGWWRIDASLSGQDGRSERASFYLLLPDPNTRGFEATRNERDSDPEAEAMFVQALQRMTAWERVRWTEYLGSGEDVLVQVDTMLTVDTQGIAAQRVDLTYAGSFAPPRDGQRPTPASFDSRSSITIGDQGWLQTGNNPAWLDQPPSSFEPPSGWGTTYAGAERFGLGTLEEIHGRTLQVVTFHLPEQPTQSEAWMAWWIDTDTGDVMRITMVARMHYMVWTYSDINGDIRIDPPAD